MKTPEASRFPAFLFESRMSPSPNTEDDDDDLTGESGEAPDGAQVLTAEITADEAGDRLDRVLRFGELSRARIQALIAEGRLSFDGPGLAPQVVTDGKHKARAGTYILTVPAPVSAIPEPQDLGLDVLFEDAHLIVINKPAGMAAHPAPGTPDGTLVNALLFHCGATLSGIGGVLRPGIVHRLDKETSGVMVAAKSDAAHRGLSELFSRHDIDREYLAVVRGVPKKAADTVTTRIGRSTHDRKKMAILRSGGREAITHYRTRDVFAGKASLVVCRLETGRTHQIRVHMAHIGCPCLGDPVYGSGAPTREVQAILRDTGFSRQALHAAVLGFVHPITGEVLRFETAPPEDMRGLITALGAL